MYPIGMHRCLPIALSACVALLLLACASATPNRDPVGERFPEVRGNGLDGTAHRLPQSLGDGPTVALVGYVQNAQFDIDRWILGLMQLETPAAIVELPTVEGIFPGMIAGRIDDGMRRGIPQEDWAIVITIYDDAEKVVGFTGNTRPSNTRALLLGPDGCVEWFGDRGYSAGLVRALDARVRALAEGAPSACAEGGAAGDG